MYLKENIKLLRKRKKRSQEEVSASLGITRSAYNSYENGVAEPGINILMKFSDFFQINIDKLIRVDLNEIPENQLIQLEKGFDLDLLSLVRSLTDLPIVAHGGCGKPADVSDVAKEGGDGYAVATILHYDKYTVADIKEHLSSTGVEVRR